MKYEKEEFSSAEEENSSFVGMNGITLAPIDVNRQDDIMKDIHTIVV